MRLLRHAVVVSILLSLSHAFLVGQGLATGRYGIAAASAGYWTVFAGGLYV